MKRLLFVVSWIAMSIAGWGMWNGVLVCQAPNMSPAFFEGLALTGPLAFSSGVIGEYLSWLDGSGFQFRLVPLSHEQRWQAFHEMYPSLSRYYFEHGHEEDQRCKAEDVTGCK